MDIYEYVCNTFYIFHFEQKDLWKMLNKIMNNVDMCKKPIACPDKLLHLKSNSLYNIALITLKN